MPERNRVRVVNGGPQVDDSWVKLQMPTLNETKGFQKIKNEMEDGSDEQEQAARQYIAGFILDWNYVNDDSEPLPKPHKNTEVIGDLLQEEFKHIFLAWNGQDAAAKAAKKK